jgi:hypothetical protein
MIRRLAVFVIIVSIEKVWSFQQNSRRLLHRSLDTSCFVAISLFEDQKGSSGTLISVDALDQGTRGPTPRERKHRTNSIRAESWNEKFEQLVSFKKKYGHVNVPQYPTKEIQESCPQLSNFCRNLRNQYRYLQNDETRHLSFLTQDRIERLESIGFVWSSHEAAWNCKYEELVKFWKKKGHTHVPSKWGESPDLRNWVGYQRLRYKAENNKFKPLTSRQIELLECIDFRWSPKDELWWNNYAELKIFQEKNGNIKVPHPRLRRWKDALRRTCREYVLAVSIEGTTDGVHVSGLNQERLVALLAIEFCWLPKFPGQLKELPPEDIFAGNH